MSVTLSCPGKTFLAGEYLATVGGPCLLAMTEPRFSLKAVEGSGRVIGIPAGSPADRLRASDDFYAGWDLEFHDPHLGAGGWGASTAQYLLVHALRSASAQAGRELDTRVLLEDYWRDAWTGQGLRPSGADLIGQFKGSTTFFERRTGRIDGAPWLFQDLDAILLRTNHKLATHTHLASMTSMDEAPLEDAMKKVTEGWIAHDADVFANGITSYAKELQRQGLVTDDTLNLLHDLAWLDGVKAAKGCGAMGADVVLVLAETGRRDRLFAWARERGLTPVALVDSLSKGLVTKISNVEEPATGSRENGTTGGSNQGFGLVDPQRPTVAAKSERNVGTADVL